MFTKAVQKNVFFINQLDPQSVYNFYPFKTALGDDYVMIVIIEQTHRLLNYKQIGRQKLPFKNVKAKFKNVDV